MQKKLVYFSMLLFIACQRDMSGPSPTSDPNQTAKQCRLVKMIQGTHNGAGDDTTFLFYYDTLGKMTRVTYHNPGYNDDEYTLTYDNSGHLINVSDPYDFANTLFSYTSNGLLSELRSYRLLDSLRFRFVYGSSTVPEKCIEYKLSYFTHLWDSTIEYHYTAQNGNITRIEIFKNGVSTNTAYCEYDTIPNFNTTLALISQYTLPLGLFDQVWLFNKNALKKYTPASDNNYLGGPYSFSYNIDSGKVVRSDFAWLEGPTNSDTAAKNTRFYYYDCK
jgi:hypothetical protein